MELEFGVRGTGEPEYMLLTFSANLDILQNWATNHNKESQDPFTTINIFHMHFGVKISFLKTTRKETFFTQKYTSKSSN